MYFEALPHETWAKQITGERENGRVNVLSRSPFIL
jgi:hypothetical protein